MNLTGTITPGLSESEHNGNEEVTAQLEPDTCSKCSLKYQDRQQFKVNSSRQVRVNLKKNLKASLYTFQTRSFLQSTQS